jgi:hypothetical protein
VRISPKKKLQKSKRRHCKFLQNGELLLSRNGYKSFITILQAGDTTRDFPSLVKKRCKFYSPMNQKDIVNRKPSVNRKWELERSINVNVMQQPILSSEIRTAVCVKVGSNNRASKSGHFPHTGRFV